MIFSQWIRFIIQITERGLMLIQKMRKMIMATLLEDLVQEPPEVICKSDSFACVKGYARQNPGDYAFRYFITLTAIHYKDKKITKQKTAGNRVDYGPSEYFSWS